MLEMTRLIPAVAVLFGCASASPPAPPEYAPTGQTKCKVAASHSEPLIVEWPSAARAKLESQAKKGLVVVRYAGCEMEVLSGCSVADQYKFVPSTIKHDSDHITNVDDLYAKLPVGAAGLEGKLQSSGELNVNMTIVGRFESPRGEIPPNQLVGDCAKATHVVTGITIGAFEFYAGARTEAGGGVGVAGAGIGASHTKGRETLTRDGEEQACGGVSPTSSSPPIGCGGMLRLEVSPIGCPSGSHRVEGRGCVSDWESAVAKANAEAAPRTSRVDEQGYSIYEKPIVIDAVSARGMKPGQDSPEAAVKHFYASMIRGDNHYQDVLPPTTDERAKTILAKLVSMRQEGWIYKQVKLLGRKSVDDEEGSSSGPKHEVIWIKVDMTIRTRTKDDHGIDSVELERIDGRWCVTRPPT